MGANEKLLDQKLLLTLLKIGQQIGNLGMLTGDRQLLNFSAKALSGVVSL